MQFPSNEDNLLVEELHVKNHLKQWGGGGRQDSEPLIFLKEW